MSVKITIEIFVANSAINVLSSQETIYFVSK